MRPIPSIRPVAGGLAAILVALAGCSSHAGGGGGGDDDSAASPDARDPGDVDAAPAVDAPALPHFRSCRGRAFTPAPSQPWRHSIQTPITLAAGAANHSAQDPIGPDAAAVSLHGKFAYGTVSASLSDESVAVWIDDCSGWQSLGEHVTDSDGRITVDVPATVVTTPGVYEARFEVLGDRSLTTGFVWLLPRGTHLAVTDIDGTMTTSDTQLFEQILDGSYVPAAYPGAVDLTAAHANRGHVVVYLTGRPYYLTQRTRDWLTDLAFAPGPLRVTDSTAEALPTQGGVGDFKKGFLMSLVNAGYVLDVAYGNATTDIYAYLGVGVPAEHVWIIGSNGGMDGTHAVADAWTDRAAEVRNGAVVAQPFAW
ncbi:MAG TPA: hypothetical protein VHE35_10180 [Kofleriaceae bacterium]|nr:hypothetical protein [Kofleriaceae bacterium]